MPNEAQLKAQMQAAIAKKKKEQDVGAQRDAPSIEMAPVVETPVVPIAIPIVAESPPSDHMPIDLTFYGHSIRFTTYHSEVYFAVMDLLPLSKVPDHVNRFIDFKNNPKTKATAEPLIKILTFPSSNGSEKTEGATAINILTIFRELQFTAPGPMGRWLIESAEAHKTKE